MGGELRRQLVGRDEDATDELVRVLAALAGAERLRLGPVAAHGHVAPHARAVARVVVERPLARRPRARLQPLPRPVGLRGGDDRQQARRARRRRPPRAGRDVRDAVGREAQPQPRARAPRRRRSRSPPGRPRGRRGGRAAARAAPRAARPRARRSARPAVVAGVEQRRARRATRPARRARRARPSRASSRSTVLTNSRTDSSFPGASWLTFARLRPSSQPTRLTGYVTGYIFRQLRAEGENHASPTA